MTGRRGVMAILLALAVVSWSQVAGAQAPNLQGDLTETGSAQPSAPAPPAPAPPPAGGPPPPPAPGPPTGQPPPPPEQQPDVFVTAKEGWQKVGASRIYDAVDGRMIVNDVVVRPYRLTRREAMRKYDNGTHGDEVPRDGVPSKVNANSTDFIGPRTAANYDEIKGILFAVGSHPDGPQRFFDLPMVSLDWDGEEIPHKPEENTQPGVYRLTSLEKRMYAFIMRDSLDIMRSYQNAEGKDLIPYNDRVKPPTGLGQNKLQARRSSKGVDTWNSAISSGKKVVLERRMLAALADTEIKDASWFPGGVTAVSLSQFRSGTAGALSALGLGGLGFGGGFPGAGGGYGGFGGPGGPGGPGLGGGGAYGGYGYGAYGGGGGGFRPGGQLIPGGVPPVPGGYNVGVPQAFSPGSAAMGFAF